MPLIITKENIIRLNTDAIVNAANEELRNYAVRRGGGVCGCIFRAAGNEKMQAACDAIGGCATGHAVITDGFLLPAKYVIHAVGPKYREGDPGQAALLKRSYLSALDIAAKRGLQSVAFPLISSGIYGYPKSEALQIAVESIQDWLDRHEDRIMVSLCLMDEALCLEAERLLRERNKWNK